MNRRVVSWLHPTRAANTAGADATLAELSWGRSRGAALRWSLVGGAIGALFGLIAFAPAAWLAGWVAEATRQHVILADARGTLWSGSAVVVLSGGPGSQDATSLPGRIGWTLGLDGAALELRTVQDCCLNGEVALRIRPGFGRIGMTLLPHPGWVGRWPTILLAGLGTPWNTLQLGGSIQLSSPGLTLESVQGRWLLEGRAEAELANVSSRLTSLDTLGTYRLVVSGDPAAPGTSQLGLTTAEGALQLSGQGTWGPGGLRFRGEATAAPDREGALASLLNIIGRRNGARSVIAIG